jgi:hypothetical protein
MQYSDTLLGLDAPEPTLCLSADYSDPAWSVQSTSQTQCPTYSMRPYIKGRL